MKIKCYLNCIICLLLTAFIIWGCKKDEIVTNPDPEKPQEEIIPGVTVGYGAELMQTADYEKIRLIQEPQIPNGRVNKDTRPLPQYDLSAKMPPVQSQGSQGSCVAWAVSYAARTYFRAATGNANYKLPDGSVNPESVFSPRYVYNQIKVSSCDRGSYVQAALDLLKNQGVCTWKDMPYHASDCSEQPTDAQKQKAAQFKIKDYGRIAINRDVFRKFLYYDMPIVIAARLNDDFKNPTKGTDGQYVWKTASKEGSGHAMVIVGYDDTRKAFKIQNSWGDKWKNNGFIWMNYDILETAVHEAYVMITDDWEAAAALPNVVTDEAGAIADGQIELKGHFTTLGEAAIIRYGIAVSNTDQEPVNKIEVTNKPLASASEPFLVKSAAVGPKLYYRAFAETLQGTVYGNVMVKEIKTDVGELDKSLLFATTRNALDPVTGKIVFELPSVQEGFDRFYEGFTVTKTHYLHSNDDQQVVAVGLADQKIKWRFDLGGDIQGYPVTDGRTVSVSTFYKTFGIDLVTGVKKWEYVLSGPGQPVIRDGHVFVAHEGRGMTMIDAENGRVIRAFNAFCGRNIATVENGILYYITGTGVIAYNVSTGAVVWQYVGESGYFLNLTDRSVRLAYANGKLITTAYSSSFGPVTNKLIALNASDGKVAWEQTTSTLIPKDKIAVDGGVMSYLIRTPDFHVSLITIDAATGKQKWERKLMLPSGGNSTEYYDMIIVGQTTFVTGIDGHIRALSTVTGQELWMADFREVGTAFRPSLITKDGKAYHMNHIGM